VARTIEHRYDDPLDLIWLDCLRALGFELRRSDEVYASFDGERTLTLSTREHFDADDSFAQLAFHELCHALVAGPRGMVKPDWGMENVDTRDLVMEHACHRLQAALADRHGLRGLFAVTTDHRSYWDSLGPDPLGAGDDQAIPVARDAYERACRGPWSRAIGDALRRTQKLAESMRELDLPADSLWRRTQALHASGFPCGDPDKHCGECAWSYQTAKRTRCRQASKLARVAPDAGSCVRFEPRLDGDSCGSCGACCREAFDRVELGKREHSKRASPALRALVVVDAFGPHLPRPGGRCIALEPDAHRCTLYADRPRSCADFAIGGDACLTARRRVGLSV
jgi:Putative zinc- or iron-chelating domain